MTYFARREEVFVEKDWIPDRQDTVGTRSESQAEGCRVKPGMTRAEELTDNA